MNFGMAIREPWTGFLRIAMPITSSLVLLNNLTTFVLALITVASTHFVPQDEAGQAYLDNFQMRTRANLIFFYLTFPALALIEAASSNYALWTDRLNPLYVVVVSILAPCIWVAQVVLWSLCLFAGSPAALARYGYCPRIFETSRFHVYGVQYVGTRSMPVWAVPSLLVLYGCSATLAVIAWRREKQRRQSDVEAAMPTTERKWFVDTDSSRSSVERRLLGPRSSDATGSSRSSVENRTESPRVIAKSSMDAVQERLQLGQTNRPPASKDPSLPRLGHIWY
ncbi:hypothetical protein BAUCODRAFT_154288 [Baudoinia panamericana UAMH 10762]|uniref:Uncharacterized protein n=1 Tax=Baudoinia panamericana (strain UAMH 10762) TaxID=717646 RepID=M2N828_BAUPA|nr:uncharacterized protein BAUCODRAFT_154288 [Baudoinia panamericana UAMH 10762]EMD00279.1 hypothetical protein BAUCODRAFT_154288 [Baudoinia panamericana UAMH 10762]